MALIKCPECSGTVSTAASACPHCGFAVPKNPLPPAAPPRAVSPTVETAPPAAIPVAAPSSQPVISQPSEPIPQEGAFATPSLGPTSTPKQAEPSKPCPACAEQIPSTAISCPKCNTNIPAFRRQAGSGLSARAPEEATEVAKVRITPNAGMIVLGLLVAGAGLWLLLATGLAPVWGIALLILGMAELLLGCLYRDRKLIYCRKCQIEVAAPRRTFGWRCQRCSTWLKTNVAQIALTLAMPFVVIFAVVLGFFAAVSPTRQGGPSPFDALTSRTLVDQVTDVRDNQWTMYSFTLNSASTVSVDVSLQSGTAFSIITLDKSEWDKFSKAQSSLFGGQYLYYPDLSNQKVTIFSKSGGLKPGSYVIAIKEYSDPNLLGSPDLASVKIKITAR